MYHVRTWMQNDTGDGVLQAYLNREGAGGYELDHIVVFNFRDNPYLTVITKQRPPGIP